VTDLCRRVGWGRQERAAGGLDLASIANDAAKLPKGSAIIVDDFHIAVPAITRVPSQSPRSAGDLGKLLVQGEVAGVENAHLRIWYVAGVWARRARNGLMRREVAALHVATLSTRSGS
jgi:hypothetical protein